MLFVIFHAGDARYALDASNVVEVLPLVQWTGLSDAPQGVAGVFDYHGAAVPLVDLSEALAQQRSRNWMSTRIIVIQRAGAAENERTLLGLMAERVTGTLHQDEVDFQPSGIGDKRIAIRSGGMIELIHADSFFRADSLFRAESLFRREACRLQT